MPIVDVALREFLMMPATRVAAATAIMQLVEHGTNPEVDPALRIDVPDQYVSMCISVLEPNPLAEQGGQHPPVQWHNPPIEDPCIATWLQLDIKGVWSSRPGMHMHFDEASLASAIEGSTDAEAVSKLLRALFTL